MRSSPMSSDKIIVSHADALKRKYGAPGLAKIREALDRLVESDARHHLRTKVVFMDRVNDMRLRGKPLGPTPTPRQAKMAVDAIYEAEHPDYLMILGAQDVVPFQLLDNPLWEEGGDDDDVRIESDLPYACEAQYDTDPNSFVGPTRVVGRLPDIVNGTDPAYIIKLLRIASQAKTRAANDYRHGFALSAQKWQASSDMSVKAIFGAVKILRTVPEDSPAWAAKRLAPRIHFINCHGNRNGTVFNGQPRGRREVYPIAHQAPWLTGKITNGAVMAAECCYGAQLYDPELTEGQPGIAYMYLSGGAYGVFGSSTIAYGPFSSNDSADLICQSFLTSVLHGASLGRATLEAWQQFASRWAHLNPEHLKTIAQFYLLGDPSIHAVSMASRTLNKTDVFKRAFAHTHDAGPRALRRDKLLRVGRSLDREMPRTRPLKVRGPAPISDEVRKVLTGAARVSGVKRFKERHFAVVPRRGAPGMTKSKRTVHVLVSGAKARHEHTHQVTLISATAEDGRLIHIRRLHSR